MSWCWALCQITNFIVSINAKVIYFTNLDKIGGDWQLSDSTERSKQIYQPDLHHRGVINEEKCNTNKKNHQKKAPDIRTSHTITRLWAKVELASHTSVLMVYQPCFYFLLFAFKPFFSCQKSYKEKHRPVTLLFGLNKKKKANKRVDVWTHQQIHTCEMFTMQET